MVLVLSLVSKRKSYGHLFQGECDITETISHLRFSPAYPDRLRKRVKPMVYVHALDTIGLQLRNIQKTKQM